MTKLLSHNVASCRLSETFSSGAETWSLHVRGNPGPVFLTHVQRLTSERPPRCSEDVQIPGASSGSGAAGPSAGGSEQLAQEPVPTGWRCSARRGLQGAAECATWASVCAACPMLTPPPPQPNGSQAPTALSAHGAVQGASCLWNALMRCEQSPFDAASDSRGCGEGYLPAPRPCWLYFLENC